MRNMMAAIGRVLAAMAAVVTVWCEQTLRFIQRCLPSYVAPDPQQLVDQYVDAVETVKVSPEIDQRIAGIQAAADALFKRADVTPEMLKGLSAKTVNWLELLDADMLESVAKAKPADLAEHLALRKQLRGVLRFEDDAIAEYRKAVEADAKVPKRPDREPDRIYPTAWHLPAFGPIC